MADRIIKGDSGNDVIIQNNDASRKIEVTNSGDVEVTGDVKTTTVKATNLKANDGTAGLVVADSTGEVTSSGGLKATNIKTTNIKANDGTAALVVADSTGQVTSSGKIDLNGNELILDADADTSITADTDDQIDLRAGGADSVKISNEHLTINDGNLIIGTAGHGIDFSVNSHLSGMSSELLDSYEEGEHTATVSQIGGGGTCTLTSGTDILSYTKIGEIVNVSGYIGVDVVSSFTGIARISLPFSNASGAQHRVSVNLWLENATINAALFVGRVVEGDNNIQIFRGNVTNVSAIGDSANQFTGTTTMYINATYRTTS